MKSRVAVYTISVLVLGLIFISGQIFYYDKEVGSILRKSQPILNGRATINLSTAAQHQFVLKSQSWQTAVEPTELRSWIESYTRAYTGKQELRVSTDKIKSYLEKIAKEISIPPANARLTINEGKVSEFEPPKDGQVLNIQTSTINIATYLTQGNYAANQTATIELTVNEIKPAVTLDKINKLGVNELLARGESDFGGSTKSRTHNLTVGARKFNGIILAPGEEFSFNKLLGDVDASTGYLPELVIKSGKLLPEYGGGLCQVSTTLFRAAVEAGLPIIERHAHSLPVRYYNPQGYDATIYPGVSDLRFKNDTPTHVLIQSKIVGSKLYFEIYGTKDGRKIVIDGPHQYDVQTNGALKAYLNRTVIYSDGQEKKDVFRSSYKSPSLFPTVRNPLE